MTQQSGGGKKAGKKDGEEREKSCPSWVNGIKCVLNTTLAPPDFSPSVSPPIAQYLQEVALGMTGGEGDPSAQGVPSAPRRIGSKPSAMQRMRALAPVLRSEAAVSACQAIFWLVLGGIFGHLPKEALAGFRSSLGEHWYAITLQTLTLNSGDKDIQDGVVFALPYAFAQAVYRLLVDGFVEDRPLYIKHGDMLLLKASQIAHIELTGFQVNADTLRRGRHRLFLRRVVRSPHVDQQEFLKGKKRQEMLESHSAGTQDQPLQFGKLEGTPLEESQLDHCLHGSDEHRREVQQLLDAGKQAWEMDTTPVPGNLSVARYFDLKSGAMILENQLNELRALLDQAPPPTEVVELMPPDSVCSSPHHSEPPSPALSNAALGRGRFGSSSGQGCLSVHGDDSPPGTAGEMGTTFGSLGDEEWSSPGQDSPSNRHKKMWRKGLFVAKISIAKEDARMRKEKEGKARKLRQETVTRRVCDDELPKHLCERALSTSWVSPPIQHLTRAPDRHQVLNKTATDVFLLTMAVNKDLPKRPLSTPLPAKSKPLRKRQLESQLGASGIATQGSRGGEDSSLGSVRNGATAGMAASAPVLPRVGPVVNSKASSTSKGDAGAAGAGAAQSANLPRVGAATIGAVKSGDRAAPALLRGEAMSMDPPPRPQKDVVARRMAEHLKAHERNSFALYAAEHDIFTGARKLRTDAKGLEDEENAYIKEMELLVGGKPKRLIAPEGVGTRHLKE